MSENWPDVRLHYLNLALVICVDFFVFCVYDPRSFHLSALPSLRLEMNTSREGYSQHPYQRPQLWGPGGASLAWKTFSVLTPGVAISSESKRMRCSFDNKRRWLIGNMEEEEWIEHHLQGHSRYTALSGVTESDGVIYTGDRYGNENKVLSLTEPDM